MLGIFSYLGYLTLMQKLITLTVVAALSFIATGCFGQKSPEDLAPAVVEVPEGMETAVVGAGCFWCVEVFFEMQEGVHDAISGYAGGSEDQPTIGIKRDHI